MTNRSELNVYDSCTTPYDNTFDSFELINRFENDRSQHSLSLIAIRFKISLVNSNVFQICKYYRWNYFETLIPPTNIFGLVSKFSKISHLSFLIHLSVLAPSFLKNDLSTSKTTAKEYIPSNQDYLFIFCTG